MELKERIINEATRLFFDAGIKSVRMDDIAVVCGISKRTLYENFSDREDLIRQSLHYYVQDYEREMDERLSHAKNMIDEFWIIFSHGAAARPSTKKVIMDLIKYYPVIFNDFLQIHHKNVLEENRLRFERGISEGLILRKIDTEFMSNTFTSYLYGLHKNFDDMMVSSRVVNTNPPPRSLQFAIMLFFRGITTEKGRRYIDENILKGIE